MKLLEHLFSIKNKGLKKVVTILGIKITFTNKYAELKAQYEQQVKDLQASVKKNIDYVNKKNIEYLIRKLRDNNYERLLADYKYNGYSDKLLQSFEMFARSKHCWFVENNNLWLLYIQVMIENNQTQNLETTIKKYIHFHNLKNVENYLAVSNYFYEKGLTNKNIEKTAKIYKKLKSSEGKFLELIKDKSIAVVGNGPVEIGKGHGKEIDSHDIVIRFNKFRIEGYEDDYGTRTDVWVNHGSNPDFLTYKQNFDYKMILWGFDILCFKNEYGIENLFSTISKEYEKFGIKEARQIWNNYGFYNSPTTGFYLIIYLYNLRGSFKNVDFYGFKFLEKDNNPQLHYFVDNDSFEAHPWHNFDEESVFLKLFIEQHGGKI